MCSRGLLMVIAGPSGAGKTTLARHLVDTFPEARFSVSCTTRAPRGVERDGVDYRFVTQREFHDMEVSGFFLEWARVHGHLYGTSLDWVRGEMSKGRSVILDIDVQGAVQVKKRLPSAVLVFLLPPDEKTLAGRLSGRATDDRETMGKRLAAAGGEVALLGAFDYFIANDDLSEARSRIEAIHRAERMRLFAGSWPGEAYPYHPGLFTPESSWKGKRVVVCSGPTREPLDEVRFISNGSSGLMGLSLVHAFLDAGADVTMISGPCRYDFPPGSVALHRVETAEEMLGELRRLVPESDFLAMAAAVSDFRPLRRQRGKTSRNGVFQPEFEPTPDLLETLGAKCPVLSFSLEYGDGSRDRALEKMRRKGSFATFINRGDNPGEGMESETNSGELVFACGASALVAGGSKRFVAKVIVKLVGDRL